MFDRIEMFLNCNETLQRKIKIFIEYFVKYYGEEKREEIEKQLSKAFYIGYMTPYAKRSTVNKLIEEESKMLKETMLNRTTISVEDKDLFSNCSFAAQSIMPIDYLYRLKQEYDKGKIGRLREFIDDGYDFMKRYFKNMTKLQFLRIKSLEQLPIELPEIIRGGFEFYIDKSNSEEEFKGLFKNALPLLQKIDPNVTIDNLGNLLKRKDVNDLLESYMEAQQQYELFTQDQKEHFEILDKIKNLEKLLFDKYFLLYIKENIDLIPESERKPLEDYLSGKTKNLYVNTYMYKLFDTNLQVNSILEYFDENSDLAFSDEKQKWKLGTIKRKRIEYFKLIGIDLGDDYDTYANNPECQRRWPTKELVRRVEDSRKKYLNKYNNELFLGIEEYREIREKIDSLDLLDKDDQFDAKLLTDAGTFITPNIRLTGEGYDVFSLFIIGFNQLYNNCLDHHIVHELNHLYEVTLSNINDNKYEMIVGWDYATGTIDSSRAEEVDTLNTERKKRDYELFNEIINEIIAQEICEMMHNDGVTIFDEPGKSHYKHTTSYESYLVLVKDFYNEYKDKIIESRRNGNIEVIFNEVGKDNFDALNSLIKEYYENFKGTKRLVLLSSIEKKEDTELTRIFYDILERWKKVMHNMKEYSQEHKLTM